MLGSYSPVATGTRAYSLALMTAATLSSPVVGNSPTAYTVDSIARPVNHTLTQLTHSQLDLTIEMVGSIMLAGSERDRRPDPNWLGDAIRPAAWVSAMHRLDEAALFEDGWKGPGSLRAERGALMGARALLQELEAVIPAASAPQVGLDEDGSPTLSWCRGQLVGSLSILDQNTYGYYIERGGDCAAAAEVKLSEPLPRDLLTILDA